MIDPSQFDQTTGLGTVVVHMAATPSGDQTHTVMLYLNYDLNYSAGDDSSYLNDYGSVPGYPTPLSGDYSPSGQSWIQQYQIDSPGAGDPYSGTLYDNIGSSTNVSNLDNGNHLLGPGYTGQAGTTDYNDAAFAISYTFNTTSQYGAMLTFQTGTSLGATPLINSTWPGSLPGRFYLQQQAQNGSDTVYFESGIDLPEPSGWMLISAGALAIFLGTGLAKRKRVRQ